MLKRLKWNVLYCEDNGEQSDASSESSNDSMEIGTDRSQAMLAELAQNDPALALRKLGNMRTPSESSGSASSEQSEDDGSEAEGEVENEGGKTTAEPRAAEGEEGPCAEWRECALCPRRRFLNDADVAAHLVSKKHRLAAERAEARNLKAQNAKRDLKDDTSDASDVPESAKGVDAENGKKDSGDTEGSEALHLNGNAEEDKKSSAKREKAKRKLKALQKRKWLKKQQQKNAELEQTVDSQKSEAPAESKIGAVDDQKKSKPVEMNGEKAVGKLSKGVAQTKDSKKAKKRKLKTSVTSEDESKENGIKSTESNKAAEEEAKPVKDLAQASQKKARRSETKGNKDELLTEEVPGQSPSNEQCSKKTKKKKLKKNSIT